MKYIGTVTNKYIPLTLSLTEPVSPFYYDAFNIYTCYIITIYFLILKYRFIFHTKVQNYESTHIYNNISK